MGVLEDLKKLKDTEDFFEYFELEYDEKVVLPYRLHIMKKFGLYMEEVLLEKDLSEEDLYHRLREALRRAYEEFISSSPLKERLFKVHKDVAALHLIQIDHGKKV